METYIDKHKLIRVGKVTQKGKRPKTNKHTHYDKPLALEVSDHLSEEFINKFFAIVYFIVVDGVIHKIGRSSTLSGIKGMLNFYLKAGFDNSGPNRFAINALMREKINLGCEIEVYVHVEEPKLEEWMSPSGDIIEYSQPIDDQMMERYFLEDFNKMYHSGPKWNFQENGECIPKSILEEHETYLLKRK